MANFGQQWGLKKRTQYLIKVRDREQWETTVHKGGDYPSTHRRRVARWGPWRTHRYLDTARQAREAVDDVRRRNALSDVQIFYGGRRLTAEQVAQRARDEQREIDARLYGDSKEQD